MKKILTIFVTTAVVATAALATEPAKKPQNILGMGKWSIRAFFGFNGGDVKSDGEVDNIYGAGLEYTLPNVGTQVANSNFAIGAEWNTSSEGLGNLKMDNYGIYAAGYFGLGQSASMNSLKLLARVGYFNTRYHGSGASDNEWGFGFDAGLSYKLEKIGIELFYRQRPSVNDFSNNAIVLGINFPIGN